MEVNFSLVNNPEKQKEKMLKLITQIDARMKSRFLRGTYLPTLNILASSKDTEQSFLEAYIENKRVTDSKNTLVVDEPQWVVDSRKDSDTKFWVGLGNKFLANELLPLDVTDEQLEEYRAKGYELWQVPIGYLDTFQQNLDEAICSIIGKATASSLKYISGERLLSAKVDTYKNPFTKDVIEVGNAPDDITQYSDFFDLSTISEDDISKPLFIHLDMSTGGKGYGDKTGIAGVWATGKVANIRKNLLASGDNLGDSGNTSAALVPLEDQDAMDMTFKLAFSVSIKAPKGAQISFAKNRNFIRWLRNKGFAIKGISMDTFQSANMAQDLASDGFVVEPNFSVDRVQKDPGNGKPVCLPYHYFKTAIYEKRIKIYKKCDQLTDEIISLERKGDGHIDHPQNGSKDQADAVCGATYLASKYACEYSYNYGDNLNAAIEANDGVSSENYFRQQLVVNFEEELNKMCWGEYNDKYTSIKLKDDNDDQFYDEFSDGIIVI